MNMEFSNYDAQQDGVEQRFEHLYPEYDDSLKTSFKEKDQRKKKKMKPAYCD